MELIEAFTRQDADLGSTFISEKEVTVKLNGEDLKNLLAFQQTQSENIATKGGKIANCSNFMTEEEFDKRLEESFAFGTDKTFKLIDDALDRDLDTYAVASQMLHTAAFVLCQHGVSLDDMVTECKDAIKKSGEVDEEEAAQEKENDEIIEALHEQGFKPNTKA